MAYLLPIVEKIKKFRQQEKLRQERLEEEERNKGKFETKAFLRKHNLRRISTNEEQQQRYVCLTMGSKRWQ